MNAKRNPVRWGFFLIWLFITLVVVVAGFVLLFAVGVKLGEVGGPISIFTFSLIITGCFGTGIGFTQWLVLRRYVQPSAMWIAATVLGFLVSCPALISISGGLGRVINLPTSLAMTALLGGCLGLAQWPVLYRKVRRSALWIGISLLSWIVGGLFGIALATLIPDWGLILYWLGLFFFGIVLSAAGMMGLLESKPTANVPEG